MKSEKGITLVSLVIYIIVFSIVLGLLAGMTNYIYGNLDRLNTGSYSSEEFNKFNLNFVKDIKQSNNARVETSGENVRIILSNNANYNYIASENAIYRDQVKISEKITTFQAEKQTINNKAVIVVRIGTGTDDTDYGKTIKYVLKYW